MANEYKIALNSFSILVLAATSIMAWYRITLQQRQIDALSEPAAGAVRILDGRPRHDISEVHIQQLQALVADLQERMEQQERIGD